MKPTHVFGYGSLINRLSIARTTVRVPELHELMPNRLRGFERIWDYRATIFSEMLQRTVEAVYLNIRIHGPSSLNGVTFAVNEEELERLRKRERHYEMIDCNEALDLPVPGRVVTFMCTHPDHLALPGSEGHVLTQYLDIVAKGCADFGPAFIQEFERTTAPIGFPMLTGGYSFP